MNHRVMKHRVVYSKQIIKAQEISWKQGDQSVEILQQVFSYFRCDKENGEWMVDSWSFSTINFLRNN